jgi:hypothetical protein
MKKIIQYQKAKMSLKQTQKKDITLDSLGEEVIQIANSKKPLSLRGFFCFLSLLTGGQKYG